MQPRLPTPTFAGLRAAAVGMKPTSPPLQQSADLVKRLDNDPAVCGWVEGSGNNPVSCNSGYTCAATSTYVGCCSTGGVGCKALFTTCYDKQGPSCKGACALNSAALICDGQTPYCAKYRYAGFNSGGNGIGYGCGNVLKYDKSVLTSTTPGVVPFGQSSSTSPSSSPSSSSTSETKPLVQSTIIAAPSPSAPSTNTTLISGGAIAGTVAGSILVIAALVGIIFFFWRRHRIKKEQERQAASMTSQRTQSYVYAQYAKPDASTLSPPMSPPMHSRQPSDQGYGFPLSPPLSDNDRPWSPETVTSQEGPAELAAGHEDRSTRKY